MYEKSISLCPNIVYGSVFPITFTVSKLLAINFIQNP